MADAPPPGMWQDSPEGIDWAMRNHPPTHETADILDDATEKYIHMGIWIMENVPRSPDRSIALNDLRAALRSLKAAIACHQGQA